MTTALLCTVCGEVGGAADPTNDPDLKFMGYVWTSAHEMVHIKCTQKWAESFEYPAEEVATSIPEKGDSHFAVVQDDNGDELVRYSCTCAWEADHFASQTVAP